MTNEEKAIELMRCNCHLQKGGFSMCNTSEFDGVRMCYNKKRLLEMARWKDEQFKELLESELKNWQLCTSSEAKYRREMLEELIEKLNE